MSASAQDADVVVVEESSDASTDDAGVSDASEPPSDATMPDGGVAQPPLLGVGGHALLESNGEVLRVTEVFVLEASETIPAPEGTPLWLQLPEGAGQASIERGEELWQVVDGGIARVAELGEGRHSLAFSFMMRSPEGRALITQVLPFPVAGMHVLWPAGAGFSARAMGFSDSGTVQMGPRGMRVLERPALAVGQQLVVIVSQGEAPSPSAQMGQEPTLEDPLGSMRTMTLVLAGLILLAGLLLPFSTRWRRRG